MGIVFRVYQIWIWEFRDPKSDSSVLWDYIWPNTTSSNPIDFFDPQLYRWEAIVFVVSILRRRVPLELQQNLHPVWVLVCVFIKLHIITAQS